VILTVATYSSPSGKKFLDEAVTPAVVVALTPEQEAQEDETGTPPKSDAPLDKALELLKAKAA
jgi:C-terminal processing protease CtpA/Prc